MKKILSVVGLILILSVALAACGGGGSSASGSTTISATMTDFKFDPNTWTVPANTSITLQLKNNGSVEHTWVLVNKFITPPFTSADNSDILFSAKVEPGQSSTVTFTSPSTPGTYEVICDIPGHLEAGMDGQLIVK